MRKITYILATAVLTLSCQREDDSAITGESEKLTFSASIADAVHSRAVQSVDFGTHGIDIAGYHTEGLFAEAMTADETAVFPNIFDRDARDTQIPVPHVTKNGEDKYVLKTVKWPLTQTSYLSYFAWSQGSARIANSGIVDATKDNTTTGYPWIDIVNVDDPSKQIDVATARHTDEKNHRVISAVDLNFKHILSKLSFVFKSSVGANVSISKMDLTYAPNQLHSKGRYTFNTNRADSIGHFGVLTGYHSGTFSLGTHHTLSDGQELTVGEMLLIPQSVNKGFLTFDLTYTISSSEGAYEFTKTVDLPAAKLLEGLNHIFVVDIYGEEIIVHNALVSDWILDATPRLPFVPGPMGDLQLLLDGYDKPYQHVDGKWYWLDRSGYNRHCHLDGYTSNLYDETDHSYRLDGAGASKIVVPAFNSVTELTTDVVCEHAATAISGNDVMQVVNFRTIGAASRKFTVQMSKDNDGNIYFDCDVDRLATGRLQHTLTGGYASFKDRTLWTFQKQDAGGKMYIYRNALLLASKDNYPAMQKLGVMDNNEIARGYNGKVFYVKVTSKMNSAAQISRDFADAKIRFNLAKIPGQFLPAVSSGLLACWDARSGLLDHSGNGNGSIWVDQSGEGFYMTSHVPTGVAGSIKYDAAQKAIVSVTPVHPNKGVYMLHEFKTRQDATVITIETVSQTKTPVFNYFMDFLDINGKRIIAARPNTSDLVEVLGEPVFSDWNLQYWEQGGQTIKRSLTYVYNINTKTLKLYRNGVFISSKVSTKEALQRTFSFTKLILLSNLTLSQGYEGNVHAFRIYNRELTAAEIATNYAADKITFILP